MTTNPTNSEISQRVKAIIADVMSIPADTIEPTSDLREGLGADSMDVVTIAAILSDEFGLEMDIDELPEGEVQVQWVVNQVLEYVRRADIS